MVDNSTDTEAVELDSKYAERLQLLAEQYQTGMKSGLQPFKAYLAGSPGADVLLIKGLAGAAELAGKAVLSGKDGKALQAALTSLGWGTDNWCAIICSPPDYPILSAGQLHQLIEILDPLLIITLDASARQKTQDALVESSNSRQTADQAALLSLTTTPAAWRAGAEIYLMGRHLLALDDFESSLENNSSKQRVWAELKQIAR
ncbi:MAG: hypothetical protein LBG68_02460 [Coriobacteriales bacterium]|nr:hypothetical protein [Coriobacteriales bacterium]